MRRTRFTSRIWFYLLLSISLATLQSHAATTKQTDSDLEPILRYIGTNWDVLTRSMSRCESIVDPKLPEAPLLYLPAGFSEPDSVQQLRQEQSHGQPVLHSLRQSLTLEPYELPRR